MRLQHGGLEAHWFDIMSRLQAGFQRSSWSACPVYCYEWSFGFQESRFLGAQCLQGLPAAFGSAQYPRHHHKRTQQVEASQ
jgi:hypothetical protein